MQICRESRDINGCLYYMLPAGHSGVLVAVLRQLCGDMLQLSLRAKSRSSVQPRNTTGRRPERTVAFSANLVRNATVTRLWSENPRRTAGFHFHWGRTRAKGNIRGRQILGDQFTTLSVNSVPKRDVLIL